jgi:hypothetical protein
MGFSWRRHRELSQAASQLQNDCCFGIDHTLPNVDLDVVEVVGVEVELSTRKLRHKRQSLLSAMSSLVTPPVCGQLVYVVETLF